MGEMGVCMYVCHLFIDRCLIKSCNSLSAPGTRIEYKKRKVVVIKCHEVSTLLSFV